MNQTDIEFSIGAHMSVEGGLEQAILRGESIGCTAIQIFTKSNRQWFAKELTPEAISLFKDIQKKSSVRNIIAHAAYLINICAPDKIIAEKSAHSLTIELERCAALGIPYLVLHPGSRGSLAPDQAIEQAALYLNKVLESTPENSAILLETMAGQGTSVGYSFDEIAKIYNKIKKKERVGVCFDTCHAFASGYDFRTKDQYDALWKEFDEKIGLNLLKAIHLNDSKKELGSRVDRHEHIGKGMIGETAFSFLVQDERFKLIPKILETPKESLEDDRKNIELIHKLRKIKTE